MADGGATMKGLGELGAKMRMLGQQMRRKMIRKAVRAGARVYRDGMKRRAPKDKGDLEKAIVVVAKPTKDRSGYEAMIGPKYTAKKAAKARKILKKDSKFKLKHGQPTTQDPGVYAMFDEFGRPNREGATEQRAQPFVRPTFDQDSDAALGAVTNSLKSDLDRELK